MNQPRISVVMATYNHAAYVGEAIESVLCQEGVDFEFLIADDGSSDDTANVVRRYSDSRIRFQAHSVNRGACTVTNELISQARGEFIAIINSDDVWTVSNKLATQLQYLEANPQVGATFGRAVFINKDGVPSSAGKNPFDERNRSRSEWMRFFIDMGNCLCHPTILIRKRCYDEVGMYNNRFRQLPDFDMWTRLIKRYDIHISDQVLIKFRQMPGENASAPTRANIVRDINETFYIVDAMVADAPAEMLTQAFPDRIKHEVSSDPVRLSVARVIAILKSPNPSKKFAYQWMALSKVKAMLDLDEYRKVLWDSYQIDDKWLQRQLGEFDCFAKGMTWAEPPSQNQNKVKKPADEAEITRLKKLIAEQTDIIQQLQQKAKRPLLTIAMERLKKPS